MRRTLYVYCCRLCRREWQHLFGPWCGEPVRDVIAECAECVEKGR